MEEEKNHFDCEVAAGGVLLSITIGQGQLGATAVFRGDDILVKGGVVIGQLNLGDGRAVAGTSVSVESIVNDVSSQTNNMSVRYTVENAGRTSVFFAAHRLNDDGDMCRFVSGISFKARS